MRTYRRAIYGFTLIELMVTISIAAILMSLAIPSFREASLNSQLRASANNLLASTRLARSEAFKRNAIVTMCVPAADGTSCGSGGWEQGWIVYVVIDGVSTVLDRQSAAPNGFKIIPAGGTTSFQFQPTGVGTTTDDLKVCRATPTVGGQERVITIEASGRAWVARTTTGVCA